MAVRFGLAGILLVVLVVTQAGCARGGVAGGVEATVSGDPPSVHQAVLVAMRTDGIAVEEESSDGVSLLIRGRYSDGDRLTVHGERTADDQTLITVQVGNFGDQVRSERLIDQIQAQVSTSP